MMRSNHDRAKQVEPAFDLFVEKNRSHDEGDVTNIADMICNLLHLLDRKTGGGLACINAVRQGIGHFASEQYDQTGLGPDALVAVDVYIGGNEHAFRAGDKVVAGGDE